VKEIPASITMEEVKGKFENWKETTSTSPITKRHLGHYQSLTRLIHTEDEDKGDDSVIRAKKILNAHFLLGAYSFK
jgi:hypothetical protein